MAIKLNIVSLDDLSWGPPRGHPSDHDSDAASLRDPLTHRPLDERLEEFVVRSNKRRPIKCGDEI